MIEEILAEKNSLKFCSRVTLSLVSIDNPQNKEESSFKPLLEKGETGGFLDFFRLVINEINRIRHSGKNF